MARGGHCSDQRLDRVVCLSIANDTSQSFRLRWCFYLGSSGDFWTCAFASFFYSQVHTNHHVKMSCKKCLCINASPGTSLATSLCAGCLFSLSKATLTISNWPCSLSSMDISNASTQRIKVLRLVLLELIWFRRQAFCDDIARLLVSCQISKASMMFMISWFFMYIYIDYYDLLCVYRSFTALKIPEYWSTCIFISFHYDIVWQRAAKMHSIIERMYWMYLSRILAYKLNTCYRDAIETQLNHRLTHVLFTCMGEHAHPNSLTAPGNKSWLVSRLSCRGGT